MHFYNPRFSLVATEDRVKKPENLVFSGGGILGLAYAGAIKALEEKGLLNNIKRYAGASAGAITAALLAIGFTPDELNKAISEANFGTFLKKSPVDIEKIAKDPKHLTNPEVALVTLVAEIANYGLCDATVFVQWLTDMFKTKKLDENTYFDENTTFTQLYEKKGIELYVMLCHVNTSKTVVVSHKNEQLANMPIVTAVRGSMSIPLVYEPLKWNNEVYVDGGTMYNYPIEVFDDHDPKNTLGFILSTEASILNPPRKDDNHFLVHLDCIIKSIMNVSYEYCFRMGNAYRTVFIDTIGISALDFSLTPDEQNTLINNGHMATLEYFGADN